MTSWASLDAFDAECSTLTQKLGALTPREWDSATNCPPWNLHELVTHITFSIGMPERLQLTASDEHPATAADYFRRPARDSSEYKTENVDRTQSIAAKVEFGEAAKYFEQAWQHATNTFSRYDPDQQIIRFDQSYSLDAYLLTRLMAVATHGLDVAITLTSPAWTNSLATIALRPVLVDLLGAEPPQRWTDLEFLEVGSGRRPLHANESEILGNLAGRFPLLS